MQSFALAMAQRVTPPTAVHRIDLATSDAEDVIDTICDGGIKSMYHGLTDLIKTANMICEMVGRSPASSTVVMKTRITSILAILKIAHTDLSRVVQDENVDSIRSARASIAYHETHDAGIPFVPVPPLVYVYFHELLWLTIGRCLCTLDDGVTPPITDDEFLSTINETLIPDAFVLTIQTITDASVDALHMRLFKYLSAQPMFYSSETIRSLMRAERVIFLQSFFLRHTPISIPRDRPDLHHPSGLWTALPPIDPVHFTGILEEYQLITQDPELPERLRIAVIASECLGGEYAEYVRVSPHDSLAHGPNTVLARGGRDPAFVNSLREATSRFRTRELTPPSLRKYTSVVDIVLYASIFAERAPLVSTDSLTRNAGRTGINKRIFEFIDAYYIPWYGWCSYDQHARFLRRFREGRRCLPLLIQLHHNLYLVRDGTPRLPTARRASRLGVNSTDALVRSPVPPPTAWYYCPSASIALCVWEQLARTKYGGNMERPCSLPCIVDHLPAPLVGPGPLGDAD